MRTSFKKKDNTSLNKKFDNSQKVTKKALMQKKALFVFYGVLKNIFWVKKKPNLRLKAVRGLFADLTYRNFLKKKRRVSRFKMKMKEIFLSRLAKLSRIKKSFLFSQLKIEKQKFIKTLKYKYQTTVIKQVIREYNKQRYESPSRRQEWYKKKDFLKKKKISARGDFEKTKENRPTQGLNFNLFYKKAVSPFIIKNLARKKKTKSLTLAKDLKVLLEYPKKKIFSLN